MKVLEFEVRNFLQGGTFGKQTINENSRLNFIQSVNE